MTNSWTVVTYLDSVVNTLIHYYGIKPERICLCYDDFGGHVTKHVFEVMTDYRIFKTFILPINSPSLCASELIN